MTPAAHGMAYRPGIDGMRAIAVLGVVLYHAGFGMPAGYTGVDVFFVISGFLITSLLEAELASTGRIDLAGFYARRARRLLPALGVVLAATVAGCFAILSPYGELSAALRSVAASSVFGANVLFQYTTGDYFGLDADRMPLLHLWSLGVEEQYYLIWPIALLLARQHSSTTRRVAFTACAAGSFAFAEWALYRGSQAAFYAMPSRWWELSLGALVAWAPRASERSGHRESILGAALLIAAMTFPTTHFPGFGALPATLGAALLVHASTTRGVVWRLLSSRPLVSIGRVSYPFYLWHFPLLALATVALPGELPAMTRMSLVIASFALAVATWRWVERPLRRMRVMKAHRVVGVTLAVSLAIAMASLAGASAAMRSPPPEDPAEAAAQDRPANLPDCHFNRLTPADTLDQASCVLGRKGSPRIAIWGDSHAFAFRPFAAALARAQGDAFTEYSRDACAPAVKYDNGESPVFATGCKAFNAVALRHAQSMDTVILASRWPRPTDRHFAERLIATVDALAPHVRRVIIIGATPDMPASVPDCLRRNIGNACDVSRDVFMERSAPIRATLSALPARHANVTYVEPVDFFCDAARCPGVRDGMALYWDDNHIASRAAAAFGDAFVDGDKLQHPTSRRR